MKEVLFAHIEREIKFDSDDARKSYLDNLIARKRNIIIISRKEENGSFILRFKEQYNNVPFFPEDQQI